MRWGMKAGGGDHLWGAAPGGPRGVMGAWGSAEAVCPSVRSLPHPGVLRGAGAERHQHGGTGLRAALQAVPAQPPQGGGTPGQVGGQGTPLRPHTPCAGHGEGCEPGRVSPARPSPLQSTGCGGVSLGGGRGGGRARLLQQHPGEGAPPGGADRLPSPARCSPGPRPHSALRLRPPQPGEPPGLLPALPWGSQGGPPDTLAVSSPQGGFAARREQSSQPGPPWDMESQGGYCCGGDPGDRAQGSPRLCPARASGNARSSQASPATGTCRRTAIPWGRGTTRSTCT